MQIDLTKQPLPKKFKRSGKDYFLDTIRKRLVLITPEEIVRQRMVSYLINHLKVPKNMIIVEAPIIHYGIDSKRRADIVVHGWNEKQNCNVPILIIECKADGVYLGNKVANQAFDYADLLGCDFVAITDGYNVYCYRYNENTNAYDNIKNIPEYNDLLTNKYETVIIEPIPERIKFEDLEKNIDLFKESGDIGKDTILLKAVPAANLSECLLDVRYKMPTGQYAMFNLIEDYGIRLLSYGNASGGIFSGPYRSFLIENNGNTEFISFGTSSAYTWNKAGIEKTYLNIAIDDEKSAHHSLQLSIDEYMTVLNEKCSFYHKGSIAIGKIGSGKISELRELVYKRYPKIIKNNRFYFGTLTNNKLWHLDDKDVVELIENLISYVLIRDEYREIVKRRKIQKEKKK